MASRSKSSKGKDVDQSTPWSEYVWDDRGYWISTRIGPTGEREYTYRDPEPQNTEATPRSFTSSNEGPYSSPSETEISQTCVPEGKAPYPANTSDTSGSPVYENYQLAQAPTTKYATTDPFYEKTIPDTGQGSSAVGNPGGNSSTSLAGSFSAESNDAGTSAPAYRVSIPSSTTSGGMSFLNTTVVNRDLNQSFRTMSISPTIPEDDTYFVTSDPVGQVHLPEGTKRITKTPQSLSYEELDPRYAVVENQKTFWKVGRVFMMLWTEPAKDRQVPQGGGTRNGSHLSTTWLKGTAYSEIRRFVVIGVGHGNNICSPINTYSGQATLKPNLPDQQQHCIIHTSKKPPPECWYYAEDRSVVRENLYKDPIRVVSEQEAAEGDLGDVSRLNYSKIYTVENYVRVLNIGIVHPNSMESLISNCFLRPRTEPPQRPRPMPPRADSGSQSKGSGGGKSKGREKDNKGREKDKESDSRPEEADRKKSSDRKHRHSDKKRG